MALPKRIKEIIQKEKYSIMFGQYFPPIGAEAGKDSGPSAPVKSFIGVSRSRKRLCDIVYDCSTKDVALVREVNVDGVNSVFFHYLKNVLKEVGDQP